MYFLPIYNNFQYRTICNNKQFITNYNFNITREGDAWIPHGGAGTPGSFPPFLEESQPHNEDHQQNEK